MASLDDFFKKRDKKKKTTTKSKLDIDEFAKKLEATSGGDPEDVENQENVNNENVVNTNSSSGFVSATSGGVSSSSGVFSNVSSNVTNGGGGEHVDEEWKPFDSDENKDYSGLRININNWLEKGTCFVLAIFKG